MVRHEKNAICGFLPSMCPILHDLLRKRTVGRTCKVCGSCKRRPPTSKRKKFGRRCFTYRAWHWGRWQPPCILFGTWTAPDIPRFAPGAVYGTSQNNLSTRREKDEIILELTIDGLDGLRRRVIITQLTTQIEKKCDENCSLIIEAFERQNACTSRYVAGIFRPN